ncbi:3'-5' exonuclease [Nitrincola nitratireducens]|uniref:Ribonuclease D n=1 Tax=Nitrincola nitratireducens TaxID=1229521 RepID=W9V578_9GAMM|nr:3'-5' exonuclease [Nitrincola nitratireducens]EXJ11277.1 Ribonuclease D [Nitrincola nitratireducens]
MERPTKEQIRDLPIYDGLGQDNIIVVANKIDAERAVAELKKHACVGFDTESKPCFKKGEVSDGPHLIQLATETTAYLFPTKFHENITVLEGVLSDPEIKKVGFGLKEDKKLLFRKYGITLINSEELSSKVMRYVNVKQHVGARVAVAMLFNQRLTKSAQKSNWAIYPLNEHQIKYAANDAHSALRVELEMEKQHEQL